MKKQKVFTKKQRQSQRGRNDSFNSWSQSNTRAFGGMKRAKGRMAKMVRRSGGRGE